MKVIVGNFGTIPENLEELEINGRIETFQNTEKNPGELSKFVATEGHQLIV